MEAFDQQLRRQSRGLTAWGGATVLTGILFSLIAASGAILPDRAESPVSPPLSYVRVPPAPTPENPEPPPPVSSILEDSLAFNPTEQGPLPEIPLEFLSVSIDPGVPADFGVQGDLRPQLELEKPEMRSHMIVFDHNEVDEKPVWLYGPMPRFDTGKYNQKVKVLVLYTVDEKGRTSNVHILDSSDEEVNRPLIKAIESWVFRAARKDGEVVKVWVQQVVQSDDTFKSPFSL